MIKRILLFIVIILLCAFADSFFSDNKQVKTDFKIEQEPEKIDSTLNSEKKPFNFLYPASTKNQIVNHIKYSFSYSENDEQPEWVAYKLFPNSINDDVKRKDNFRNDLKVITGSASIKDYKKSGYDRGHLAPAKTMSFSPETMSESFYMSNMSPQNPSFNRGIWKKLEGKVRNWISISDSLYVVTGPVLKDSLGFIGGNRVTVPRAYYKSIIRFKNNEMFGIGFLLKNEKSSRDLKSFSVSIDSIEKITGLDFFENLTDAIQNKIEKNSNFAFFIHK